ncbi:uncharacterized protein FYW23_009310 isoform 2-T5 [Sylvia borin]
MYENSFLRQNSSWRPREDTHRPRVLIHQEVPSTSAHSITQISLVVLYHLEWKEKEMLTENCCLLEVPKLHQSQVTHGKDCNVFNCILKTTADITETQAVTANQNVSALLLLLALKRYRENDTVMQRWQEILRDWHTPGT